MIRKPTKPFSIIVSIITILNLLATLFVGAILLFSIGVSDPGSNIVDIEAFIKQKDFELRTAGLLILIFMIGFIISITSWLEGKRYWGFIFSGFVLLHLIALTYLVKWYFDFSTIPHLFFPTLDLIMLVAIFLDRIIPNFPTNT